MASIPSTRGLVTADASTGVIAAGVTVPASQVTNLAARIVAGTNITITTNADGNPVIASVGGGAGSMTAVTDDDLAL